MVGVGCQRQPMKGCARYAAPILLCLLSEARRTLSTWRCDSARQGAVLRRLPLCKAAWCPGSLRLRAGVRRGRARAWRPALAIRRVQPLGRAPQRRCWHEAAAPPAAAAAAHRSSSARTARSLVPRGKYPMKRRVVGVSITSTRLQAHRGRQRTGGSGCEAGAAAVRARLPPPGRRGAHGANRAPLADAFGAAAARLANLRCGGRAEAAVRSGARAEPAMAGKIPAGTPPLLAAGRPAVGRDVKAPLVSNCASCATPPAQPRAARRIQSGIKPTWCGSGGESCPGPETPG